MKFTLKAVAAILVIAPLYANAGGNPEHVKFPEGYEKTFTKYATMQNLFHDGGFSFTGVTQAVIEQMEK